MINLGSNDFTDGTSPPPAELTSSYRAAYLDMVVDAAASYGAGTTFFLACGPILPSRYTYCASVEWVRAEAAARGLDAHVLRLETSLTCCEHPSLEEFEALADHATPIIRGALGW